MVFAYWGWRFWVLLILAAVGLLAYLGDLPPVESVLEQMGTPAVIERLANQPAVAQSFSDPFEGRMDAYAVLFLFVFVTPLALFMAVTLVIFVLSALASALGPVLGGEKSAALILEIGGGILVYAKSDAWLPHVAYFLGLIARAYVAIRT
jgi:hypothetical protein